ncbi:MAG: VWA domain-containing protein [Candidatus Sedimenticola sp. (ex Thyasira tokunagai)]
MAEFGFHFASPWWLGLLVLILPVGIWLKNSRSHGRIARMSRYADPHLLPHLTGSRELEGKERWRGFALWALLWGLLVVAMAGPRWDYTRISLFTPGANLIILLDISRSMSVTDVAPSRLTRARQEIEDLIDQSSGLRVGLIAFASVAHVLTPVTEDTQSLRKLLPAISTDLARLQGSRLSEAVARARTLLAGQPEKSRNSILLISDGDFADSELEEEINALAREGIPLHVLGIGTPGGGPVAGMNEQFFHDAKGQVVESRLDSEGLMQLAELTGGSYQTADFRADDSLRILQLAATGSRTDGAAEGQTKVWNERFFWLLIPVLLMLLPLFRKSRVWEKGQ